MFIRTEQKAATRARILETARKQLERDGYDGTSIRSVAGEAKVAAGTVLLHFRDKQDLLHAALFDDLETTWARAREVSEKKMQKKGSLERALTALARAFFDYYAERPALSRALLRESLFAAPPWSQRFAAQVAEVHAHVAQLAGAAKSRGELEADVDVALLGAAFFSFYYFALMAWLQGGHAHPLQFFERLLRQHLDGLAPRRKR
ncbi:TetR family transcriptional regulator [Pendulispora brunnea]|uniref:TetR family transcriptional regulator n=1 Tax=Pendulispora brunnea TaxID=2905690 RepID=A0ABZ2KCI3_9BACT